MADKKKEQHTGGMEVLAKMSVKTLKGDPGRAKKEGKDVPLCRIYGIADHLIAKQDRDGNPIVGIGGNFEGVDYATGTKARSGVLYLPSGIHEQIVSAVDSGELDDKDRPITNSVRFALEIIAVPATNPHGYSYKAKHLMDAAEDDPLAELAGSLPDMPALPAPE